MRLALHRPIVAGFTSTIEQSRAARVQEREVERAIKQATQIADHLESMADSLPRRANRV